MLTFTGYIQVTKKILQANKQLVGFLFMFVLVGIANISSSRSEHMDSFIVFLSVVKNLL